MQTFGSSLIKLAYGLPPSKALGKLKSCQLIHPLYSSAANTSINYFQCFCVIVTKRCIVINVFLIKEMCVICYTHIVLKRFKEYKSLLKYYFVCISYATKIVYTVFPVRYPFLALLTAQVFLSRWTVIWLNM